MRKNKFILLIFVLVMSSCKNEYVLDIDNVPELSNAILESEKYMKKILENLPEIEEKIENMRKKVEGKAVVESYADFLVKEGK